MHHVTASASVSSRLPADVWHLLGAGSIGSLAAHRLLQSGYQVRSINRQQTAQQRTLHWPDGRQHTFSLPPATLDEPIDRLLLAVKAGDTRAALQPLVARLHPTAVILRLQNGMGSLGGVALPAALQIFHLVTTDGAWRNGEQVHVVAENQTLIGVEESAVELSPPSWFEVLQPHWPSLQWCQDIERAQWRKLAVNAVINPLTALHRCRNGELLDGAERQQQMAALAAEVDQVLSVRYPDWPMDTLARSCEIATQTAANTSSMLADVLAGRTTELRYINGYLLDQAKRIGLLLPAHQSLTHRL